MDGAVDHALLPGPRPDHHVATVLDALGDGEFKVVGLLVHVLAIGADLVHGIGGEVAMRTRDPVLLVQVLEVNDLGLGLSGQKTRMRPGSRWEPMSHIGATELRSW